MITDAVANAMLDNQFPSGAANTMLSAHSAFSATGANLLGAKTSANFAAAASRAKNLAAVTDIAITAGQTVRWIGVWDSTGVTFRGMQPNGADEKNFQVDLLNNRIYCEGHGYSANQTIVFSGGTPPAGLVEGTVYYAVGITPGDPDYFQVAATSGGAAVDIIAQAAAGCKLSKITEETFVANGTLRVSTHTIGL